MVFIEFVILTHAERHLSKANPPDFIAAYVILTLITNNQAWSHIDDVAMDLLTIYIKKKKKIVELPTIGIMQVVMGFSKT